MRLLLDTHTLLYFITGSSLLSPQARSLIEDPLNEKLVSVISLWEIAIKHSIGKLSLNAPFGALFPQQLTINGFDLLPVEVAHLTIVASLPFHHRDPFD